MITVILVIHLLIAIAMVALILLQRSEGGALGIGGSGGGPGVMSGRAAGNLLTRSTGVLAAAFMATSLALAIMASGGNHETSVLDVAPAATQQSAPTAPDAAAPDAATPATSQQPEAPADGASSGAASGAPSGASSDAPQDSTPSVPSAPMAE